MGALLVATTGGHLAQLVELARRLPEFADDRLWATFDSPQSRSLLADERVAFIPPIAERDVLGVVRGLAYARKLLDPTRIEVVVSTGSAIALSFLPYAAWRGIEAHYVESAARVGAPSLTGRLLEKVPGLRLYRQYPGGERPRWRYVGSVFDGFVSVPREARPIRRVVVTVGGVEQSFRRLIARVRDLLPEQVEVLWQTGHTPVRGLGIEARPFLPAADLQRAMAGADVVIAHGGCGSALSALEAGRHPILVARDPARGELIDDHQPELTGRLAALGLALERTPEELTWNDVEMAAARTVRRAETPPPFRLARSP